MNKHLGLHPCIQTSIWVPASLCRTNIFYRTMGCKGNTSRTVTLFTHCYTVRYTSTKLLIREVLTKKCDKDQFANRCPKSHIQQKGSHQPIHRLGCFPPFLKKNPHKNKLESGANNRKFLAGTTVSFHHNGATTPCRRKYYQLMKRCLWIIGIAMWEELYRGSPFRARRMHT